LHLCNTFRPELIHIAHWENGLSPLREWSIECNLSA
jgi:hypothetical protein